jgi:holin-like protein
MLMGLFILIGCQLVGELIVGMVSMPIPGSVLGMLILFIGLIVRGGVPADLNFAAQGLIKNIGVLFIPAGAGLSLYLSLIVDKWDVILIASVISTILTLVSCALLFKIFSRDS